MTSTHYANPNGLFDARQVTTARDLGILASALLREFPEYAHYFSQQHVAIGKRRLMNRNSLIRQMKTADGMKTGFVCNSGYNLVALAHDDKGRRLIAVVLGAQGGQARADHRRRCCSSPASRDRRSRTRSRSARSANAPLGDLVPADMTQTVCKRQGHQCRLRRRSYRLGRVASAAMTTPQTADMALRGRLLGAREVLEGGKQRGRRRAGIERLHRDGVGPRPEIVASALRILP